LINTDQKILKANRLSKNYGAIQALNEVDFEVGSGELCGLIGPNGSGKTTFFDCCTGLVPLDSGMVMLEGQEITHWPLHRIAREGKVLRSFQKNVVFGSMTVEDNLTLAGQMHIFPNILSTFLHGLTTRNRLKSLQLRAAELLDLVGLSHMRSVKASELSVGQQKLLQFAAVLMPSPRLVLLDEPLAGVNPVMIENLSTSIQQANKEFGTGFVIIEHKIDVIMEICPRIVVFNIGRKIADGSPAEILRNQEVVEAYLGV